MDCSNSYFSSLAAMQKCSPDLPKPCTSPFIGFLMSISQTQKFLPPRGILKSTPIRTITPTSICTARTHSLLYHLNRVRILRIVESIRIFEEGFVAGEVPVW